MQAAQCLYEWKREGFILIATVCPRSGGSTPGPPSGRPRLRRHGRGEGAPCRPWAVRRERWGSRRASGPKPALRNGAAKGISWNYLKWRLNLKRAECDAAENHDDDTNKNVKNTMKQRGPMLQLALLFRQKLFLSWGAKKRKIKLYREFSKNRCQLVCTAFREGTALQCFKLLYS